MEFFDKINVGVLIGMICALVGGVMLVTLRGFFIIHPLRSISILLPRLSDRANRRSLALALAGTLGVGNIYGVAVGIILGGAGSLFWLFVSAIFALVIKYSECVMASSKNDGIGKGMMGVLPASFGRAGKPLSKIYALLMLLLSLLMGSFIQADSLISSAVYLLPVSRIAVAVLLLILVAVVISGGGEKIKSVTELMIPFVTAAYVILALIVIIKNTAGLGGVVSRIISSAFNGRSLLFGIIPTVNITAFSEGFARGILSNEAGVGTSSIAHTEAKEGEKSPPAISGLFGMCEIFFDTLVLCMLTGFMILLTVKDPENYKSPMTLVFDAVRLGAGDIALPILLLSIFFFAYSTIICWYYYGGECIGYLGLSRFRLFYLFLFLIFIILASFVNTYLALITNDLVLLLMSLPTGAAILKNRKIIREETKKAGLIRKK